MSDALAGAREGAVLDRPVAIDEAAVLAALDEVPDPELPVASIVDLGMIGRIDTGDGKIRVELLPTFVGCPALELIRDAARDRLLQLAPGSRVDVVPSFSEPWTSDRITERGRARLAAAGIAPPEQALSTEPFLVALEPRAACPHCGSTRTRLENAFGPTLCRTIRYCLDCRQPFEQLKTI